MTQVARSYHTAGICLHCCRPRRPPRNLDAL